MLIDLLNQDDYISFSVKSANIFGINTSVYCSVLINILSKVIAKKKFVKDDYFKVDRKYITNKTTLSVEDQLRIEYNLQNLNIIEKNPENLDIIRFDVELYASTIYDEDVTVLKKISQKVLVKNSKSLKEVKRKTISDRLKKGLSFCKNDELREALKPWIDAVIAKTGYLTKDIINVFWNTLNEFTKGDLDLALKVVEIATINGYRDCNWAIVAYKKGQELRKTKNLETINKVLRVTKQKVIKDEKDLSDVRF